MMHGRGESDSAIVAAKPTNKAERSAAEPVEPRAEAEGNASQQSTHRAQCACHRRWGAYGTSREYREERAAHVKRGSCVASNSGGRRYFPRPWTGMAESQRRPCKPRPAQGHVCHRELPHGGPRRACRAMRGLRPYRIAYNSCRNRHCPKCQGAAAKQWLAECEAELLPVPYYHVVFTLPAPISDIAYQNKAVIYDLLFKASAETLITIAADPKHLGARIGVTSVLHTWGSAMTHHPHVHMIVPGGGIALDGERWVSCRPGFFLPVRVLSRLFRRLFLTMLVAAHKASHLKFFGNHAALADTQAFADYLAPLKLCEWVVYSKRPFGGPEAVLAYLSRYTHRVAISNSRLIALDAKGATFKWKDYRAKGRERAKVMTLASDEFIRR